MKFRKCIGYAYPTSPRAQELGHEQTGCYYLGREILRENHEWSPHEIYPGSEGEACPGPDLSPDLISLYSEIDLPVSPYCLTLQRRPIP